MFKRKDMDEANDTSSILWELGERLRKTLRGEEDIDRSYSGQLKILSKEIQKMRQIDTPPEGKKDET